MSVPRQPPRMICNDPQLADTLRPQLATLAPGCELLSRPEDCSQAPFCRWLGGASLGEAGQLQGALLETIDVLEQTRHAFASRELGQLRRRLVGLLKELSDNSQPCK